MTSIIPLVEEKIIDGKKKRKYGNNKVNMYNGLKLQRNTPLPHTNSSLVETLGLRIVNKSN